MTFIDYRKYFHHPANNFVSSDIWGKDSEHEFGNSFAKWFNNISNGIVTAIRELPVPGSGIADLIIIKRTECMKTRKLKTTVQAFEFKLKDWRKGLMQAHRYKYFSNSSVLVVPAHIVKSAQNSLDLFKQLDVGLWVFNISSGAVTKKFTPRPKKVVDTRRAAYILDKAVEGHFIAENAPCKDAIPPT